jgi:hypothetical protein
MITNRAIRELELWAHDAGMGNGDEAKQHLVNFRHIGAGFIASTEFQGRCQTLFGRRLQPADLEQTCCILDAIANLEVTQLEQMTA